MANENDIKSRIVLEGEREYRDALKAANRELKTLRSELKAETAELGANATAQQKNEVRMKSLQKQIKEQEKIVQTYKKALDEVKEKYSDNEEEVAKWEQKLNNARATLANMQNDLEGVNNTFKDMQTDAGMATVATKSVADSLKSIGDVGEFVSDSVEGIFTTMLSFVRETISDIWADIVDLAARSNGLVDLAGFWNTDVTTIQKYKGAVESVSGTLEDLNSIVTKINAGDSKKITELTGVSAERYKDQWEYAMAVMSAMSKMDTQTRNNAAFDIFGGRQATKAFDLLNDWENLLKELDTFDVNKGGYGLTAEELQEMSALYDEVNKLESSWKSLKDMATVKLFGSLSMDITGNAQSIVDGFLAYFNAENDQEREAALKQIEDNILEMFTTAKQAILDGIALLDNIVEDLKGSDNPAAQTLGGILGGLVDALQWITEDNMRNVVTALEVLAAFWLVGKGASMAAKIASVVKDIAVIKGFSGGAGVAAGAAGAAGGAGAAETAAGGGLLAWLGNKLIELNPNLASGTSQVVGAAASNMAPMIWDWWSNSTNAGRAARDGGDVLKGVEQDLLEIVDTIENNAETFEQDWRSNVLMKPFFEYGENSIRYWDQIFKTLQEAEEYAEQVEAELQEKEQTDYHNEPDENWVYGDEWSMEEILQDIERRNNNKNGADSGEGITNENLSAFNALPTNMTKAVAKGVSGIKVYLDGQTVGRLVAPYVSQEIASQIGG